ncbi:hypothetical protein BLOT_016047 [Blomia tropicalis]|nr:hypothetical protein BLOT_016047 [Blomia tropicalis]
MILSLEDGYMLYPIDENFRKSDRNGSYANPQITNVMSSAKVVALEKSTSNEERKLLYESK